MQYRAYIEEDTATVRSDESFPVHEWVHVAIIHADDVATMYWNGVSVATGPAPVPREVVRTNSCRRRHGHLAIAQAVASRLADAKLVMVQQGRHNI